MKELIKKALIVILTALSPLLLDVVKELIEEFIKKIGDEKIN